MRALVVISGLVSQLVSHLVWDAVSASLGVQLVWDAVSASLGISPVLSAIWPGMLCPCFGFASKISFAFCAPVWGLRQCNSRFYIILRCVAKQAGQVRLARQWRARAQNESNEYDRQVNQVTLCTAK